MTRRIGRRSLLAAALAAPTAALAGCGRRSPVGPDIPTDASRFGVVAHLERAPAQHLDRILASVQTLGVGTIRGVVFPWSHIEAPRGRWKWEATDQQLAAVERAGLDPIGHLGPSASWASSLDPSRESNPWGWSDYPPDDMGAWREYVRRIVGRYAGRIRVWSPYNEPDNLNLFCAPRNSGEARSPAFLMRRREAFLAMQEITFSEAKRADPECVVLSGAFSVHGRVDTGFLPWLMQHDYGSIFDVFDVHAYDTAASIRSSVMLARRLMGQYGIRKPVWMSEVGAAVRKSGRGGRPFTPDDVAAFVPKALATALSLGVERLYWYLGYHDQRSGPPTGDLAYALITRDGPTPAAATFARTTHALAGCRYVGPMAAAVLGGTAQGHMFRSAERSVLVAWAEAPDRLPNSPARADAVTVWQGRPRLLSLTEKPIMLVRESRHA